MLDLKFLGELLSERRIHLVRLDQIKTLPNRREVTTCGQRVTKDTNITVVTHDVTCKSCQRIAESFAAKRRRKRGAVSGKSNI